MLRLRIVSGTVAVRCNEGETRVGAIVGELLRAIRGRFTRGATYCRGRGWRAGKVPQVSRSLRRKGKEITWKWREYALPSSPPSPLPPFPLPSLPASLPQPSHPIQTPGKTRDRKKSKKNMVDFCYKENIYMIVFNIKNKIIS